MKNRTQTEPKQRAREQAVDWLLRLGDGDAGPADQDRFERWLAADPLHRTAFEEARKLFRMSGAALAEKPEETRRALRKGERRGTALLAALAVVLGAGFWLADGPLRLQADAITGTDETRIVDLPDGSRIHLNASSAIAENFASTRRAVRLLRGEAYFEVAPDSARPFLVEAGDIEVRVLGTAFNINVTAIDTEVTVTENKVQVSPLSGGPGVALVSGERVAYLNPDSLEAGKNRGGLGQVETVRAGDETPWRTGRLVFEERPFERVAEELSRHMPGRFIVMGNDLRARRISGSFDLKDPQAALDSFAAIFGVRVMQAGPLLTLIY